MHLTMKLPKRNEITLGILIVQILKMILVGYISSALTPNQNSFSSMLTTFDKNYFNLFCNRYNGNTHNCYTLKA